MAERKRAPADTAESAHDHDDEVHALERRAQTFANTHSRGSGLANNSGAVSSNVLRPISGISFEPSRSVPRDFQRTLGVQARLIPTKKYLTD